MNITTRLLYQRLDELQPGGNIGYQALGELVSADVQKEARSDLNSAMGRAANIDGVVCVASAMKACRCLRNEEIAAASASVGSGGRQLDHPSVALEGPPSLLTGDAERKPRIQFHRERHLSFGGVSPKASTVEQSMPAIWVVDLAERVI